jgi:RNA polymerase sigma-70 factor, ECF subfamily
VNDEFLLIDAARQGDVAAFRTLVERYKKTVYHIAYDLTGQHHAAEDLSQDVFIKLYRSIATFRGDAVLKTWLYRVTVNTYLSQRRKKAFHAIKFFSDHDPDGHIIADSTPIRDEHTPDIHAEAGIMQQHIKIALDQLSPRERTVFVMRHYQDLPLNEIADVLMINIGTVKSTLFRAVKRLQKSLAFYKPDFGLEETA